MEINLEGIVIIVGNYGSGKTEVAINLAVNQKRSGMDVSMADLDLVNPYFRTREAKKTLARLGIDVIIPPAEYFHADLPILTPQVAGIIRHPSRLTILDAGGDDAGAKVLAALADHLEGRSFRMLQVVNPFRPYTDTIEGCLKIKDAIEAAAKLKMSGLVGNANLMEQTLLDHIYEGFDFAKRLGDETGLPLEFITAGNWLFPKMDMSRFSCPVLPIERQLVPPWKASEPLGL